MIEILYTASFMREAKRLSKSDKNLSDEIAEKIELFQDRRNHSKLKVHRLHGRFSQFLSFSINYKFRIIFELTKNNEAIFHDIGDHDLYK